MKTEQTLMNIMFALCATLVFGSVLAMTSMSIDPVPLTQATAQSLPLAAFSVH